MNSNYKYAKGDLINKPQKYQMSPYFGANLLKDYEISRKGILNEIKIDLKIKNINEIFKQINYETTNEIIIKKINGKSTKEILLNILWHLIVNSGSNVKEIIDLFAKKFEIKKQIFTFYSNDFKNTSNDYSDIMNYLLLSTILLIEYTNSLNLKYLNTVLKINDTICSQFDKINDKIELSLLRYNLENEMTNIEKISILKEINI